MTIDTAEHLSLKWGSLKSWEFNEGSPAHNLIERYFAEPVSASAMLQRNTENQKQIILEIIDAVNTDKIYLEWDGKYVGKDEAKEYVLNYDKAS